MKTKRHRFTVNSTYFDAELPVECPHCGSFVTPKITSHTYFTIEDYSMYLIGFFNDCCDKRSYALYKKKGYSGDFLSLYPTSQPKPVLPDSISKISPRFVSLYGQCFSAECRGDFELAGSGYRNALEVLIKDFAINELGKPTAEVCKKKLAQAIEAYMPNIRLAQSADVIRVLGNDYTHYERRYDDIDFAILKQYIQIFLNSIDCEYLIRHPVVPTGRTFTESE